MNNIKIKELQIPSKRTHFVIVRKEDSAEKNKLVKKSIENEYKNIFAKTIVVRVDQIDKNFGRGYSPIGIEFRTLVPKDKYEIICETMAGAISFVNYNRFEENEEKTN